MKEPVMATYGSLHFIALFAMIVLVVMLSACQKGGAEIVHEGELLVETEEAVKENEQEIPILADLNENELTLIWKPYATAYVSCEDFARILGWDYAWDADSFMFQDHEIQLDFMVGSLHVTRQGQIVDVMP